jgi:hypothetical protein
MTEAPASDLLPEHGPARVCRNCGAAAAGSYCPNCGQETSLALPTVRAMLREAAGRYVAFDGRMWRTLFALLFRPGFLTREYFAGRRRRYIRPARLFLVLSIALFALLRLTGDSLVMGDGGLTQAERDEIVRDATDADEHTGFSIEPDLKVHLNVAGASWLDPLQRRIDAFNQLSQHGRRDQVGAGLLRYGPYAAFVLLPLFALLLKIVYVGRARRYPLRPRRYAAHLVFGAHSHAFLFLVGILSSLVPVAAVRGALVVWAIVYLLRSMKTVYGGRWTGVVVRALVIFVAYSVFYGIGVAGLVVAAVLVG